MSSLNRAPLPNETAEELAKAEKMAELLKKQQVTGETLKQQQMKLEALKDERQQQKPTIFLQLRQQIENSVDSNNQFVFPSKDQLSLSEEEKLVMAAELNALKMKLQMSKASLVDQLRDQEEAKANAMNTVPATSVKDGDDAPKFDEEEES